MGIQAHFLQDKNQERFYPYGHAGAVYDKNGDTVQNRLDEIDNAITNISSDVEEGKEIQSDWNEIDASSRSYIKNKPTSMPASDVSSWAKADTKPEYSWSEIKSKPTTFTPTSHSHNDATVESSGFMSSDDKTKLDTIEENANNYIHPKYTAKSSGLYKVTVDATGHVSGTISVTKSDITALGIPGQDTNTTYSNATTEKAGLMSELDKEKLDGISLGANKTTVDSSLSSTSINPVQNKVVNSALSGKVPTTRTVNGKALSENITLAASDVGAIPTSQKGATNGVAELDNSGKVPSAQLPSFVDDVVEGYLSSGRFYKESGHTTEINAESGKIYVDLSTNKTYRWSGSAYAEISASLALGETSTTAYRGDRGKIAYEHSQKVHAPSNAEANVQSDWSVSDTGSDAYIKNKPTSLPANGGNSSTVNGHSVQSDVPANAVFTDTKPVTMKGATSSTAGSAGYAPAPAAGKQSSFLRGDGTWVIPTNTNTTYTLTKSGATITLKGSDGSETSVTDSNTTYSLSSFGITATASELNYMDGVTSNVQTQLNGKASTTHSHNYAGSSSAGGAANSANKLNGTVLTNQNLDDYHSGVNFYYASGGNTCTNKPSGIGNFGMLVFQSAGGWWTQLLYGSDDDLYTRRWGGDSWTSWSKIYTTTNKPTASEIGAADSNHSHSAATTFANGFMSSADKSKLDGIASGANKYAHPSYTAKSSGLYKVTVDSTGHVSATTAVTKSDITALGIPGSDTNTTYSAFKGATSSVAGGSGLVPAPASGQQGTFLRGDGTWANPATTTYSTGTESTSGLTKLYTSTGSATDGTMTQNAITTALNGKASTLHTHNYAGSRSAGGSANSAVKLDTSTAGSATQPVYFSGGKPVACTYTLGKSVPSNAVFTDTNTWIAFKGATTDTAGTAGYAPAPSAGAANRYLRSDGTWSVPPDTNTTYSNMSAATASTAGKAGLVPAPSAGAQSKYLRGDGTWQTPPNTTYSTATTSTSGLMSASDKSKLDGIASGANKYTLPTASSTTLGGVKTTSSVTSTSGLTACPIISGVPYYKDTNTTYTLSSFGITATAAELNKLDGVTATATELNYVDGVTSNIQTQLNGKAPSSHNHSASNITSGTLPISRGGTGATTAAAARTNLGVTNVTVSTSEPTTQSNGDFWLKEI